MSTPTAEIRAKSYLLESMHPCVLLVGGSNVRQGVLAESFANTPCKAFNAGISGEGETFNDYIAWLGSGGFNPTVIVYSTSILWGVEVSILRENGSEDIPILPTRIKFPEVSISRQILSWLDSGRTPSARFSKSGDELRPSCGQEIVPRLISSDLYRDQNSMIGRDIERRLLTIRRSFPYSQILFRFPPIYALPEEVSRLEQLAASRRAILELNGIRFIRQGRVVFDDKTLFCDWLHASESGRISFTRELVDAL